MSEYCLSVADILSDIFDDEEGDLEDLLCNPSDLASFFPPPPLVKAYSKMTRQLVNLRFPTEEAGWVYRKDMGGNAQHRWEYDNSLVLVARHSTCAKAVLPRQKCRNCSMKHVWRRECADPDDTFFLFPLSSNAVFALSKIVVGPVIFLNQEEKKLYASSEPKVDLPIHKRTASEEETKLERVKKLKARCTNDQTCFRLEEEVSKCSNEYLIQVMTQEE